MIDYVKVKQYWKSQGYDVHISLHRILHDFFKMTTFAIAWNLFFYYKPQILKETWKIILISPNIENKDFHRIYFYRTIRKEGIFLVQDNRFE